jgi:hypothetical protein
MTGTGINSGSLTVTFNERGIVEKKMYIKDEKCD